MIRIIREKPDHTKTPEFKRWFRNSKVVDDRGNPQVVYHGTNHRFHTFDLGKLSYTTGNEGHFGAGFYFSFEILEARTYGRNILSVYLSLQNPFDASKDMEKYAKYFGFEKEKIGFKFDSMFNALSKKDKMLSELYSLLWNQGFEEGWDIFIDRYDGIPDSEYDLNDINDIIDHTEKTNPYRIPDYLIDQVESDFGKVEYVYEYEPGFEPSVLDVTQLGNSGMQFTQFLKDEGYDGVIAGSELVAFYPNQIKSATDNNGDFSLQSNNIYESRNMPTLFSELSFEEKSRSSHAVLSNFKDIIGYWSALSDDQQKRLISRLYECYTQFKKYFSNGE